MPKKSRQPLGSTGQQQLLRSGSRVTSKRPILGKIGKNLPGEAVRTLPKPAETDTAATPPTGPKTALELLDHTFDLAIHCEKPEFAYPR